MKRSGMSVKHLIATKVSAEIKKWLYLIVVVVLVTSIGQGVPARAFSPSDCSDLSKFDQGCPLSCNLAENHREIIDEIVGDELVAITEIKKWLYLIVVPFVLVTSNCRQGVPARKRF